jgi:hypothetical protein
VGIHDDPIGRGIGSGGYGYTYPSRDSDAGDGAPPDITGVQVTYEAGGSSASAPSEWGDCGAISSRTRAAWAGRKGLAYYSLDGPRTVAKFTWEHVDTGSGEADLTVRFDGTPSYVATAEGRQPVASYEWSVGGSAATIEHMFEVRQLTV